MSYVVYHKETTLLLGGHSKRYKSAAAAKGALTRAAKADPSLKPEEWAIAPAETFHTKIEKTKEVKNLIGGGIATIPVNTPHCCDPSTETYWSM
jgi:hypothetical protein